jgi:hypothetical protein
MSHYDDDPTGEKAHRRRMQRSMDYGGERDDFARYREAHAWSEAMKKVHAGEPYKPFELCWGAPVQWFGSRKPC